MRRVIGNLTLALVCTLVLLAGAELVLRTTYEPPAHRLARNIRGVTTTPEYSVEYATDESGFRNRGHTISLKIAVIGDSFVFGSGVGYEDIVTTRLSGLLGQYDVWNFGVPGTGPCNALYLWRDMVRDLGPQVVVVCVYAGNDAFDALRESREARPRFVTVAKAKMVYWRARAWWRSRGKPQADPNEVRALPSKGWNAFGLDNPATLDHLLDVARRRGVPEDSIRARFDAIPDSLVEDALAFRSNPFNLADAVMDPDGLRHNLLLDTPRMEEGWKALETALGELNQEVKKSETTMVLVCIPAAVQVDSTYWWLKNLGVRLDRRVVDEPVFQDRLAAFATREKIEYIDLLPVMRSHPGQRLYYEQDGHWNPAGHALAAQAIADRIRAWLPAAKAGVRR